MAAWGCCCRGGTTFAVLPDAEGVPGGEAGLGLPGVLGLDELQKKERKKERKNQLDEPQKKERKNKI